MKNQYKQRQKQIEKSIRNDWRQNSGYERCLDTDFLTNKNKEKKPKLVVVNGKLKRIYKDLSNGIPSLWDDVI